MSVLRLCSKALPSEGVWSPKSPPEHPVRKRQHLVPLVLDSNCTSEARSPPFLPLPLNWGVVRRSRRAGWVNVRGAHLHFLPLQVGEPEPDPSSDRWRSFQSKEGLKL